MQRMFKRLHVSKTNVCSQGITDSRLLLAGIGERGGLVVNASDSGYRGRGFEPLSGQTVLCP